jgi:hypothetical protein
MKRIALLSIAVSIILISHQSLNAQQEPRRPATPVFTNDDVSMPRTAHPGKEENIMRNSASGSPLSNARMVLEGALTKMRQLNSVRVRIQASLPIGQREIQIETVKPDRAHIISPDGEIIVIGKKFYLKSNGVWQLISLPPGGDLANSGIDFQAVLKQMISKSGVRITGQILGDQMMDGVDTVAYEFSVADASQTGTIQISVGKQDGYVRLMSLSEGGFGMKIWFTNLNEEFSIEPPM